jgi:hypothetical protein
MSSGDFCAMTLEEQLLRVLYEAPASEIACVAEMRRSRRDCEEGDVRRTLADLADRQCIVLIRDSGRFRIAIPGSERLAMLTDMRQRLAEAVRS